MKIQDACSLPGNRNMASQSTALIYWVSLMRVCVCVCVCVCVSHSVVSDSATPWTVCSLSDSSDCGILQARVLE